MTWSDTPEIYYTKEHNLPVYSFHNYVKNKIKCKYLFIQIVVLFLKVFLFIK